MLCAVWTTPALAIPSSIRVFFFFCPRQMALFYLFIIGFQIRWLWWWVIHVSSPSTSVTKWHGPHPSMPPAKPVTDHASFQDPTANADHCPWWRHGSLQELPLHASYYSPIHAWLLCPHGEDDMWAWMPATAQWSIYMIACIWAMLQPDVMQHYCWLLTSSL